MKITPKKTLGQNFLTNPRVLDKIAATAELSKDDTVLEIGPGTGNLTKKLAEKAGRIIAIEKDHRLIDDLENEFRSYSNVEIIEKDVLELEPKNYKLETDNYKIVANIPYYITSHFLRTVFEKWPQPKLVVLTIQKEVARRIIAKPPHMNLLALSVQFYSKPEIIGYISKNNFRPVPKVDSAIIKLTVYNKQPMANREEFFKIIRAGFSGKRKKLINNLANLGIDKVKTKTVLMNLDLKETVRAENLSLDDWLKIVQVIKVMA